MFVLLILGNISFISAESIGNDDESITLNIVSNEKINTTILSSDMFITEKGQDFNISLFDNKGNPLNNESIIISVNGKDYYRSTDENGIAKLTINLNQGNYEILTKYEGNSVYNNISVVNNIFIRDDSTIFILDKLTNIQIQEIIDLAKENSNIEFVGKEYNDISLKISKSLNIISNVGTILNGINDSHILSVLSVFSGEISGFTLSNGLNGIYVFNSENIIIINNNIKNNKNNGILLMGTTNISILENNFTDNHIAISLSSAVSSLISNNMITNNFDGIYFDKDTLKTTIEYNDISYNKNYAINVLEDSYFIDIYWNNITFNGIDGKNGGGVNLNALIEDLNMGSNLISENYIGIRYGENFVNTNKMNISYNVIIRNSEFEILAKDYPFEYQGPILLGGPNYFGGNDTSKVKICSRVHAIFIMPNINENGRFSFGSNPQLLPTFTFSFTTDVDSQYPKWHIAYVENGVTNLYHPDADGEPSDVIYRLQDPSDYKKHVNVFNEDDNPRKNTNPNSKDNSNANGTFENNNLPGAGTSSNQGNNQFSDISSIGGIISSDLINSLNELIANLNSDVASSVANEQSSTQTNTESSSSNSKSVKVLIIEDEIFRVLGIGNLIILLILVIGFYYSKDIKKMFARRRNDS